MGLFDFFKSKKKNILNDNGLNKIYCENGKLREKFTKVNGKKHGIERFYYEDGTLKKEENWVNGKENGLTRWYYENGQLNKESNFIDGKENGLIKFYNKNGQLEQEVNWKNDKANGLGKKYYESGQLEQEVNWKNDEQDGLTKLYYENGQLSEKSNYKDGKKNGLIKLYYENGQLELEGNMCEDEKIGLWKFYNEDGKVEEINYDSVSENGQVELTDFLTEYAGFEGIQRYLNERENFAGIFDRFNMALHKGETIEYMIKIISRNYNKEQKIKIKRGFYDVLQILETLSKEEEKTLIKIKQPQLKEEFDKRFGSSKPIPDGLDVVLIALHPDLKDTLQELFVKL